MESLGAVFSPNGRIAPKAFWIGASAIYLASFFTQFLLAAPVTARASVLPFVLAQAGIAWLWYALHAKRLRAAGRPIGPAVALSVLYVLAIVLLLLVVAAASAPGGSSPVTGTEPPPSAGISDLLLLLFILGVIFNQPNLGIFGVILLVVVALVLLPIVMAIAFTVWVGTRPSTPAQP